MRNKQHLISSMRLLTVLQNLTMLDQVSLASASSTSLSWSISSDSCLMEDKLATLPGLWLAAAAAGERWWKLKEPRMMMRRATEIPLSNF